MTSPTTKPSQPTDEALITVTEVWGQVRTKSLVRELVLGQPPITILGF